MASNCRKKNNNNQGILFRAEMPHFFQFILGENKLRLPRKFVRNYGHNLSSPVTLKVPSGVKWKVEVVKSVGAIWLQNGWPEFVDHYNIVHGSFLVFEYDKNNGDFDLGIFDKTTTEIDYLHEANIIDEAERPRFVKIIDADTIGEKKMAVPKKFVRDYGYKLSNWVILKLPNEEKWKIGILKANGQIWLENKWQEFMEFYSIVIGCPVVFQYDESISGFNVEIFDHTYMEIDYPYRHTITNIEATTQPELIPKVEQETTSHEVPVQISPPKSPPSVEILDHFSMQSRKTKAKSPMSTLPPKAETLNCHCPTSRIEGNRKQKEKKLSFRNHLDAAKKSTSTHQYCQVRILSDCLKNHILHLPKDFVDNIEEGSKAAMLEVNSRLWPVNLCKYEYHDSTTAVLSKGWCAFARDNSLKIGDVCNFILIDNSHQTLLMKVSIMRDMFAP